MKKLIATVILTLFTTISIAQTITVINSGKAGGSFNARTQMYKDGLEAAGYEVKFENVGKISQAVKMFKASDEPTIMVYANNQVYKQDLSHTENNFILAEYQQPLYVCRTDASKGKIYSLTVAHGKGYDPTLLTKLLGDNIILVPYKNSGAMLKGILGGDVDMMVNNQGKSLKYAASGKGTCEVSTDLPIMMATVIGKNVNVKTMRKVLMSVSYDKPFVDYRSTRKLDRPAGTWLEELNLVRESEANWQ
jgi:hypothetical protein